MRSTLLILIGLTAWFSDTRVQSADWLGFRGADRRGKAAGTGFPTHWDKKSNIKWSVPLPGPGNGSPIVVGGRVFLVLASDQGRQRSLLCFDRLKGTKLWEQTVSFPNVEETHKTNPHGATTPVSDGKRVVVWHGSAGTHCYDLDGNPLWSRDLGTFRHIWGYASSPVIHDGKVFQFCGPGDRQLLVALDLENGEILWKREEPGGKSGLQKGRYVGSWATPLIIEVQGKTQVLFGLPTRVIGLDPDDGQLLWSCNGVSSDRADLMYTTPLEQKQFVVALGGFGGPAMGIQLGGQGDITEQGRRWHRQAPEGSPRNPQRIGSGIVVDEYVYLANADGPGSIECFEMRTGQQRWKVRRTSDGPHWASLLLVDGKLYATGQNGITRVFEPNPQEYVELAVNDLGEQINATPAPADGEFFIRTWDRLYCISAKP